MNRTNVLYAENETELPCLTGPSVVYDQNHIGQQGD